VPYWSEIERMSVRRAPLPASAPRSPAALIYMRLWAEVRERLVPTSHASARDRSALLSAAEAR